MRKQTLFQKDLMISQLFIHSYLFTFSIHVLDCLISKTIIVQQNIQLDNIKMEEFYRRKYLSPSYNRVTSYVETIQKDKTVAQLRKQLHDCKEMQQKFDDLCLQIVKLQRQNKKLESDQSQVQTEYMQKIKLNKAKITELKQTILDYRQDSQSKNKKVTILQAENDQLLEELQRIKKQAEENMQFKQSLYDKLQSQEALIAQLQHKIEECKSKVAQSRKENQITSEEVEKSHQSLKRSQLKLKEDQLDNQKIRNELQDLIKLREEWTKKNQIHQIKLETVKKELEVQSKENCKLELKLKQAESQKEKENQTALANQKQLKLKITKSKQGCQKVKNCQQVLLECFKNLQKDKMYYEKMAVKQVQLKKGNQRLQEILSHMEQTLVEEQESYNRIIGHMKFSIQQDEKAIESLSKQANLLQHMIN